MQEQIFKQQSSLSNGDYSIDSKRLFNPKDYPQSDIDITTKYKKKTNKALHPFSIKNVNESNAMNSYYESTHRDSPTQSHGNRSQSQTSAIFKNIRSVISNLMPGSGGQVSVKDHQQSKQRFTSLDNQKPDMAVLIAHINEIRHIMNKFESRISTLENRLDQQNECLTKTYDFEKEAQKKFSETEVKLLRLDIVQQIVQSQMKTQSDRDRNQELIRSETPADQDLSIEISEHTCKEKKIAVYTSHQANSEKKKKFKNKLNQNSYDDKLTSASRSLKEADSSGQKEKENYTIKNSAKITLFSPSGASKTKNQMTTNSENLNDSKEKPIIFFSNENEISRKEKLQDLNKNSVQSQDRSSVLIPKQAISGSLLNFENTVTSPQERKTHRIAYDQNPLSPQVVTVIEQAKSDVKPFKTNDIQVVPALSNFNAEEIDFLLMNDSQVSIESPNKMRSSIGVNQANFVQLDLELADESDTYSINNFRNSQFPLEQIKERMSEGNSFMDDSSLSQQLFNNVVPTKNESGFGKKLYSQINKNSKPQKKTDVFDMNNMKPRNTVNNYKTTVPDNNKDDFPQARKTVDDQDKHKQVVARLMKNANVRMKKYAVNGAWLIDFCTQMRIEVKTFEVKPRELKVGQVKNRKGLQNDSKLKDYSLDSAKGGNNLDNIYKNIWLDPKFFINNGCLLNQNNQLVTELDVNKDYFLVYENIWNQIKQWGYEFDVEISIT